jgi:hypothetical protein
MKISAGTQGSHGDFTSWSSSLFPTLDTASYR